jgi:hypothetical protein
MAEYSWRRMAGAVTLALAGFTLVSLVEPESIRASCAGPQEGGRWWNKNASGDPISLEVALVNCGDQVLNGQQTPTTYGVTVFVKQSSGNLYQRPRALAVYRTSNRNRWLYAKVPTGGYVDHIWLRPATDHPDELFVYIKHESLDSKPSAESKLYFVRTRPPAPPPPVGTGSTSLTEAVRRGPRVVPR